jgi:hypothetical protein
VLFPELSRRFDAVLGGAPNASVCRHETLQLFPKAHVDTEITRYPKDGMVHGQARFALHCHKDNGRWGIKTRSSFDTVIAASGDQRNSR